MEGVRRKLSGKKKGGGRQGNWGRLLSESEKRGGAARREKRRGKLGEFWGFRLNKKTENRKRKAAGVLGLRGKRSGQRMRARNSKKRAADKG